MIATAPALLAQNPDCMRYCAAWRGAGGRSPRDRGRRRLAAPAIPHPALLLAVVGRVRRRQAALSPFIPDPALLPAFVGRVRRLDATRAGPIPPLLLAVGGRVRGRDAALPFQVQPFFLQSSAGFDGSTQRVPVPGPTLLLAVVGRVWRLQAALAPSTSSLSSCIRRPGSMASRSARHPSSNPSSCIRRPGSAARRNACRSSSNPSSCSRRQGSAARRSVCRPHQPSACRRRPGSAARRTRAGPHPALPLAVVGRVRRLDATRAGPDPAPPLAVVGRVRRLDAASILVALVARLHTHWPSSLRYSFGPGSHCGVRFRATAVLGNRRAVGARGGFDDADAVAQLASRMYPVLQTQAPLSVRSSLVPGSHFGRSGFSQLFDGILAVAAAKSSPVSLLNRVPATGKIVAALLTSSHWRPPGTLAVTVSSTLSALLQVDVRVGALIAGAAARAAPRRRERHRRRRKAKLLAQS